MASNSFSEVENAILLTLLYSDIFDFPLTTDELWKFLISEKRVSKKNFFDALRLLEPQIVYKDGYYCLREREKLVVARKSNLIYLQPKFAQAKKTTFYLSHIPTIQFIGISGGLAMNNVTKEADIDLFIIAKKGTLFVTRFWILCVLEWLGLRRKKNAKNPRDKICVNLLIDESKLSWPEKKRDLYTAHEIAQVIPLFQRNESYRHFMESNQWIRFFLTNCQNEKSIFLHPQRKTDYHSLQFLAKYLFAQPFEQIMYKIQTFYMKRSRTTEEVTKSILALHPKDYRVITLAVLRSKCDKLGLLTKF